MNELIKVNYETEQPTVSARDLHEKLNTCKDFAEFFIEVCKMKVSMDTNDLKVLMDVVNGYIGKFNSTAIVYLQDCILTERILPCKAKEINKQIEKDMQREVANNFKELFPDYTFQRTEKPVDGIGRIDIFATYKERPVILELKVGRKNPNSQLIAYASRFENPILIAINQEPISETNRIPGIKYLIFEEMKRGVSQWIV